MLRMHVAQPAQQNPVAREMTEIDARKHAGRGQRIDDRTTLTWALAVVAGMMAIAAVAAIVGTSVRGLGWLTFVGAVVALLTVAGITTASIQDWRSRR